MATPTLVLVMICGSSALDDDDLDICDSQRTLHAVQQNTIDTYNTTKVKMKSMVEQRLRGEVVNPYKREAATIDTTTILKRAKSATLHVERTRLIRSGKKAYLSRAVRE